MISHCNSSRKKSKDMTPNSSRSNLKPSNKVGKVSFEATSGNCHSTTSREVSLKSQVENELRRGCRKPSRRPVVSSFEKGGQKRRVNLADHGVTFERYKAELERGILYGYKPHFCYPVLAFNNI